MPERPDYRPCKKCLTPTTLYCEECFDTVCSNHSVIAGMRIQERLCADCAAQRQRAHPVTIDEPMTHASWLAAHRGR